MSSRPWCLIVGCGYVGLPFAQQVLRGGADVYAVTRTPQRGRELESFGVQPVVGSWLEERTYAAFLEQLSCRGHNAERSFRSGNVLVAVPHRASSSDANPSASQAEDQSHVIGLQAIYQRLGEHIRKLIYLSTTGVYGSRTGAVDEATPTAAERVGPQIAVKAEEWLALKKMDSCVLRLAGIYGPGRVPLAAKLKQGEPLAVPQHGSLNLIHVADIVRAIEVTLADAVLPSNADATIGEPTNRDTAGSDNQNAGLYVVSDNHPVQRADFYQYLAELCGVSSPVFVLPDENSSRGRRAGDKQVVSDAFWRDHGISPLFEDYRAGLKDSLQPR